VRGEDIKLVDGGSQRRSFTDVADGIAALIRIIENRSRIADGKIYNIGNPDNDISIRELAEMMLAMALEIPEYQEQARQVNIVEVGSVEYYGKGYQDIQSRVPYIDNTCEELDWAPQVSLESALQRIFETYRTEVAAAGALLDSAGEASEKSGR